MHKKWNELVPELWSGNTDCTSASNSTSSHSTTTTTNNNNATRHRYRLVPYEEAANDGRYTRFICRLHTGTPGQSRADLAETLSEFPSITNLLPFANTTIAMACFWDEARRMKNFGLQSCSFYGPSPRNRRILLRKKLRRRLRLTRPMSCLGWKPVYDGKKCLSDSCAYRRAMWPSMRSRHRHRWPYQISVLGPTRRRRKTHLISACLWASATFRTRGIPKGKST
jgi:hypothetical protein